MGQPLRVLITTSTFPIHRDDGLPRFVADLAEFIARRCSVTVLAPAAAGVPLTERTGGIDVCRFRYFVPAGRQKLAYGHGMRDNLRGSLLAKAQIPFYGAAQAFAVRSLVRKRRIQVVNSHWLVPQGLTTALALGRRAVCRHVLSVHAGDVYLLRKLVGGRALARFVLGRTDHVFADGSHVRRSLDELVGHSSGAFLQPMGVRTELFADTDGNVPDPSPYRDGYLVFVGRFAEKKGVAYLLRAMPRVLERYPGLGLILVGYGTWEQKLRQEAAGLGIEAAVQFAGPKTHGEVARYLRGCRAAVVPSVVDRHGETDGMPTVVVEAMAAGTRVVATAVDGIPDLVRHEENGWLCRQKDSGDLAEKVLMALDDPAPSAIVRAARQAAADHDWGRVADRYTEVFEHLTRRLGGPAGSCSGEGPAC